MTHNKIAILMGTHQGEEFLAAQMDSLLAQTHRDWELWISDDDSRDNTLTKLEEYRSMRPADIHVLHGSCKGSSYNFLSLLCNENILADYYCYSDQDDVWHNDKLERALDWLSQQPQEIPCLYCSRTNLINEKDEQIGCSPLFTRLPSFSNALVQNIAGGNTMVMNQAARKLLVHAGPVQVNSHDWWTYIAITAVGGYVHYDPTPSLDYRQHGDNLMGSNRGWQASFSRIQKLSDGQFRRWNGQHLTALESLEHFLQPENKKILTSFHKTRNHGLFKRLWHFKQAQLYRQTPLGNLGLLTAAIMKRI